MDQSETEQFHPEGADSSPEIAPVTESLSSILEREEDRLASGLSPEEQQDLANELNVSVDDLSPIDTENALQRRAALTLSDVVRNNSNHRRDILGIVKGGGTPKGVAQLAYHAALLIDQPFNPRETTKLVLEEDQNSQDMSIENSGGSKVDEVITPKSFRTVAGAAFPNHPSSSGPKEERVHIRTGAHRVPEAVKSDVPQAEHAGEADLKALEKTAEEIKPDLLMSPESLVTGDLSTEPAQVSGEKLPITDGGKVKELVGDSLRELIGANGTSATTPQIEQPLALPTEHFDETLSPLASEPTVVTPAPVSADSSTASDVKQTEAENPFGWSGIKSFFSQGAAGGDDK